MQAENQTVSDMHLFDNVSASPSYNITPTMPEQFYGIGSLESFLAQFEEARHNKWTGTNEVDSNLCVPNKAALLLHVGAELISFDQLVEKLWQRCGAELQIETFRAEFYCRQKRAEESLGDFLRDIQRLVVLGYPVPSAESTKEIARAAFLQVTRDRKLSLKVPERERKTTDEAYPMSKYLGAFQLTSDTDDSRSPTDRIRETQDANVKLQVQLDNFCATQRKWQRELEEKIFRQLEEIRSQLRTNRVSEQTANISGDFPSHVACCNCWRVRCQPYRSCTSEFVSL